MENNLSIQYNNVVNEYQNVFGEMNAISVNAFKKELEPRLENVKKALDFGSGLGDVIIYLQEKGIECSGVDASLEMVTLSKQSIGADIRNEDFAKTTFESSSFDLVTSKWAMQTSEYIDPIYKEASRLLMKNGYFIFLVVHPLRQFIEKKKDGKDYFKKEIVDSIIFDGAITVYEPSHTLSEYLSPYFFQEFNLCAVTEGSEFPAAEQINGDNYPTYLIITAQKK